MLLPKEGVAKEETAVGPVGVEEATEVVVVAVAVTIETVEVIEEAVAVAVATKVVVEEEVEGSLVQVTGTVLVAAMSVLHEEIVAIDAKLQRALQEEMPAVVVVVPVVMVEEGIAGMVEAVEDKVVLETGRVLLAVTTALREEIHVTDAALQRVAAVVVAVVVVVDSVVIVAVVLEEMIEIETIVVVVVVIVMIGEVAVVVAEMIDTGEGALTEIGTKGEILELSTLSTSKIYSTMS